MRGVCIGRGTVALFLVALVPWALEPAWRRLPARVVWRTGCWPRIRARWSAVTRSSEPIPVRTSSASRTARTSSSVWDLARRSWAGPDQLGALRRNATIRGGRGDDLIHGGPRNDVIYGGPGNDLIIDTGGTAATIFTGSGRDRVVCARGSVDRVFVNRGDSIAPACRRARGSQVVYRRSPPAAADGAQVPRDPNGCDNNSEVNCEFRADEGRLRDFWSSQQTAESQCPPDHEYLLNHDYVPFGTNAPFGVEIVNIGNVGFYATRLVRADDYVVGAHQGMVTNWAIPSSPQHWEMWLHCTSDQSQGWKH